jgi:adenosylmethionine-8-amino-7-oxononanoate aminotransferase
MGNPLACRVALESLRVFEEEHYLEKIAALSQTLQRELLEDVALRAHPAVADVRVLGATAVIEAHSSEALKGVAAFARARGVWLRPIGRWLYTMPAYIATDAELTQITGVMKAWFLESRH